MDLEELKIDQVINNNFIEDYTKHIEAIWWQIVELDTDIYILNKLSKLPFETFHLTFPSSPFWGQIYKTLFDMSLLIIWRISFDPNKKSLTLNKINQLIQKNSVSDDIIEKLKTLELSPWIVDTKIKVEKLRHKLIGHSDIIINTYKPQEFFNMYRVRLNDLEKCRDDIVRYFDILCFDHNYSTRTREYLDFVDSDRETDIDKIFNLMVKDSPIFKMQDEHPEFWEKYYKKKIDKKDLEIIDYYRAKLKNV